MAEYFEDYYGEGDAMRRAHHHRMRHHSGFGDGEGFAHTPSGRRRKAQSHGGFIAPMMALLGMGEGHRHHHRVHHSAGAGVTTGGMYYPVHSGGVSSGGKRRQSPKMKARADLVRKLMHEQGMTLAQASHYIKAHKLM